MVRFSKFFLVNFLILHTLTAVVLSCVVLSIFHSRTLTGVDTSRLSCVHLIEDHIKRFEIILLLFCSNSSNPFSIQFFCLHQWGLQIIRIDAQAFIINETVKALILDFQ